MKGIAKGMALTIRHFFSKSVTVQYPYEKIKPKDRFRGQLTLIVDPETKEMHCTACGLCAKTCPDRLIAVTSEKVDNKRVLTSWQFNLGACMFCGLCVEACPFGAITMSKNYELAEYSRKQLLYNKERLLKNAIARAKKPKAAKKEAKAAPKSFETTEKGLQSSKEAAKPDMASNKIETTSGKTADESADKNDSVQLELGIDPKLQMAEKEKTEGKEE